MIRRARIALASALALFVLIGIGIGAAAITLRTNFGRERARRLIVSLVRRGVHGSVYVGHITDGFLTGLSIDSLAIRDPDDSLFLSSGPVTVHYDVRDLLDRRILLRNVRAEHPLVYLRQHEDGTWNFRTIFPRGKKGAIRGGRGLGDYIVIDSAVVRGASFLLTLPWHPSPTLHRAARDSAIRFELSRKDHEIRHTKEGFVRTWRWTGANATLVHGRVNDPDSTGRFFVVQDIGVDESDPPFLFSHTRATLRQLGDSIWVEVPHWELPASYGSGNAKIWWGSNLPVRYAIHVNGDSIAMRDVAWVYPTLPRTGGGRTQLDIHNEPQALHLTDYVLTHMDVRSTRSHLTGRMTFTLGEDTLAVTHVQLAAAPVNFDLLRTLNGKPFPYDWQGDITGTVRASGGNLGRFKVEDAQLTFADAHVPGAVSRGSAAGEFNIYEPRLTKFHHFMVNAESFDLRTPQYLNKDFARLHGTISGTAVLDSSWLDVRFHDADIVHHDGPGPTSHVTGAGRVTWGAQYLTYDLDLQAQPVSFTTISRSYPSIPLRGDYAGPIRVQGQSPDLHVTTTLAGTGGAGTLTYDGQVDADPPAYAARGTGTITAADANVMLDRSDLPHTAVNGTYAVDLRGDTLPRLRGAATVTLARSTVGPLHIDSSFAGIHLDAGMLHVDSLAVHAPAGQFRARGTVALTEDRPGSLDYTLSLTSLGDAVRLLGHRVNRPLSGAATVEGTLSGTRAALALVGTTHGHDVSYGTARARHIDGAFALRDVTHTPSGTITLDADSLLAGPIPVDSAAVALHVTDSHAATFTARFAGRGTMRGGLRGRANTTQQGAVDVHVDSAALTVDSSTSYALSAPLRVVADTHAVALDSLLFTRRGGGTVAIRHARLAGDSVQGSLHTSGVSLALLQLFTSAATDLTGALKADVDVYGVLPHPQMKGSVTVEDGSAFLPQAGTRLDHIAADIAMDGDTVRVRTLSAETNKEHRGTLDVAGTIAMDRYDDPVFDLHATAHDVRAIDKRGVATLDVSTMTPISVTGPYHAAVVRGGIQVDRGSIFIPDLIRKRVIDLSGTDLAGDSLLNRHVLPSTSNDFVKHLRLEDVDIRVGDDVWLRSAEANIKLGGSLTVTLGNNPRTGGSQLALEGQLNAIRGTYRLDIVPLVQPIFDVEQGTLRFYGAADLDPALDITAINTVRKPQQSVNGQDVRIRATIGGTLSAPTLTLSSADNLPLTQSDLLSYLITGQPAFALDYTTQQYVNQLAGVVVRSAGSAISSAIPRSLFDVVDLQTPSSLGALDAQTGADNFTPSTLLNTRAVFGKQLNSRLFLNFTTGFCAENFRNNLGLRLEYHLNKSYTALMGLEPGSSDLACARNGVSQSIQQTPPQVGMDLFRAWRF